MFGDALLNCGSSTSSRASGWTAIIVPDRHNASQTQEFGPFPTLEDCRPFARNKLRAVHEARCTDCSSPKQKKLPECEGCDDRPEVFGNYLSRKNCDKSRGFNVCEAMYQ